MIQLASLYFAAVLELYMMKYC